VSTSFLYAAGTNGYTTSPFSLFTTELNALGSGSVIISSVNGTSGKFTQSNFGNSIWGHIWFKAGGAFTPTGSPSISIWYVNSTDGGTTFEKSSVALPRSPDIVIPMTASAYASGDIVYAPGLVRLPAPTVKLLCQNNAGVAFSASGHIITCGPVTLQSV
jgi:hypothetical protein